MAIAKAGVAALRVEDLTFDSDGATVMGSATQIRFFYQPGEYTDFFGSFTYDQFGRPSGTITGVTDVFRDKELYTLTDAHADVQTLFGQPDALSAVAYALDGNDLIYGRNRDDSLTGFAGNDRILGGGGTDILRGMQGVDVLNGGDGNDILIGGRDADRLIGGGGADTFTFTDIVESTAAAAGRDRIMDFNSDEGDKIDLSRIDAIAGTEGSAFTLVSAFDRHAGQLVIQQTGDHAFLVLGDTDGNGRADFGIAVNVTTNVDVVTLTGNDFML